MSDVTKAGTSTHQRLLAGYYVFGAVAWRGLGAIFGTGGPRANGLVEGLALSLLKATVWILPAVSIARIALREPVAPCLGLTTTGHPVRPWRGIGIAAAFLMTIATLQMLIGGRPNWSVPIFPALVFNIINAVIEEVTFRGFILQQLARRHPFWRANLLQTLLFLVVHWMGWFAQGERLEIIPSSIALGLFALVLGWITRLTGSVWLAVVAHTVNNFWASRFPGGA
jgi:membrane protease YdiL (CAAX protease family)